MKKLRMDVYVRTHGIFRDVDLDGRDPKDIKRERMKRHIHSHDLDERIKLFFYGPSGFELSGSFADSILLYQAHNIIYPGMNITRANLTSELKSTDTKIENPLLQKFDYHTLGFQSDPCIGYPHAIFSRSGWEGVDNFRYPNASNYGIPRVLNYDIGHEQNPQQQEAVRTAIITFQFRNGEPPKKEMRAIREDDTHSRSLYALIDYYKKSRENCTEDCEIRIHWVACRAYAQDNRIGDAEDDFLNGKRLQHKKYCMESASQKSNARTELNTWLDKHWSPRAFIF